MTAPRRTNARLRTHACSVLAAAALLAADGFAAASARSSPLGAPQTRSMGSYTGGPPSAIPQDLRDRARFLDGQLNERKTAPARGCVVLQSPAPGEALASDMQVAFLVADQVPAPQLQGLSLAAAQQLADQFCLSLVVVADCAGSSDAALTSSPSSIVAAQCTPPETLIDIGGQIGVVVSPADDPQPLLVALLVAVAVVAAIAAAFALVYYARYRAARDELEIFKSPRREK